MVGMLLLKILSLKRYPMMAERQVVIVKEAQESYHRQAESYADNPMASTVLVICYTKH
jgi:DNA polymerase-3 subunit delta